jgi:histidinol-phosphate aminotransferase
MSSPSSQPIVRPGIMDIAPYVGGESTIPGFDHVIKLASNEGALGPSPRAVEAYLGAAGHLHRYPDGGAKALRAALARRWDIEAERIVCGAGSDELIQLLVRAYAGPGDEVLQTRHGFLIYGIAAESVGATPVKAPETDLTADVDALLAAVTPRTKLVFVANPNNPTGTCLPASEIARLHAGLPSHVVLVLDAAYAEYVTRADYEPGIELVRRHDNVAMLRTFSKIFALGALRLGWGYFPPAIADVLNRVRAPFSVSTAAQSAGVAALEDVEFFEKSRAHNTQWLAWLTGALRDLDIGVMESAGNFVLARFSSAAEAEAADRHLRSEGIIVRRVGSYGLPQGLRITVGREDEMRALVEALTRFRQG